MNQKAKDYLTELILEPSTWRGVVAIGTAVGISLEPDDVETIVAVGLAIIGLIGASVKDKIKKPLGENNGS